MNRQTDLLEILEHIDPSRLGYQDWCSVGMALKEEGYSPEDWERWSMRDSGRYHSGECRRKWGSFNGAGTPVTGGTIVQIAREQGWAPAQEPGRELDWDDMIQRDEKPVIDTGWIEEREVSEPVSWNPKQELIKYLETLFDSTENVGYVTRSFEKDGKHMPSKGVWDRTAGQLLHELYKCSDMLDVIGDYNHEAGAWIRFNPLDGKGVKNDNVTEFRYALVESDSMEIEKQNAVIRELELPVACLVHSGGKSLHAVVRVDAADYQEYRKRVDYLYNVCNKNGLKVDGQNKNPSRLSRMPGIMRNGKKQFLVDTNIGKASWNEWHEYIESISDDLPEPESLESVWNDLPELSPCLIEGVLRKGHKMLIAGPSKAGKSFLQIELCIAIAEGLRWLEWQCAKGKVMYVNLELDRASCLHRFRDVYETLGLQPDGISNIDIWNLRGKSVPMDKLAPKLIRRAAKKDYVAIVIDPIYKVITGDENSANQMADFCNQFDKVCTELECAVIYCHHHSKGSQGAKRSMDRASGSGVFARDPDALLDLIELETTEALMKQEENKAVCGACSRYLDRNLPGWRDEVSQDDPLSSVQILEFCRKKLTPAQYADLNAMCSAAAKKSGEMTAWRIEGTLREFPKFQPVNLWFDYPVHRLDDVECLKDVQPDAEKPVWQRGKEARKKQGEAQRNSRQAQYNMAIENFRCEHDDVYPTVKELYERMKSDAEAVGEEKYPAEKTIWNSLKKFGYTTDKDTKRLVPLPEKTGNGNK